MQPKFVHLRLHTEYSIVDGLVRIQPLIDQCIQQNMPAIAVTDRCNFFGMIKFYQAAVARGIKPIIGADVLLHDHQANQPFILTLLCQNQVGYNNLTKLISKAYTEGQHAGIPLIKRTWLEHANEGLIALSGGRYGDIGRALIAGNQDLATELLGSWLQYFPGRFYIELQRTDRDNEELYIQAVLRLVANYQEHVPVVATNDVRFLQSDDFEAHEARVCIHDGYVLEDSKRPKLYSEQQYLRSEAEMLELFADIPAALAHSVEIAKRCNLELVLGKAFLPQFPVPESMSMEAYFEQEVKKGLQRHQDLPLDPSTTSTSSGQASSGQAYLQRLQYEIDVINQMGFAGYFLIVADFVRWSKEHDIPVGPGRGSGAGSLVAYALGITDIDPIKHELLFERFLNPERVSMPDFDIDFCMEGRDRVIDYVAERYGRESVSQIITFGSMAAKAVVRDVGRVLGHPYGYVDKLAKLIPFELGITLTKAMQQEDRLAQLYKEEEEVRVLIDLALKLEGLTRNAGKHAGGVVISPSLLTDFAPLYCEEGGKNLVTQFDKNDVEAAGLVKFDFLGLRTLTIIKWALQDINSQRQLNNESLLDINKIPLDDPATFKLLQSCATTAVFQLESRGMRDLVKRQQPDCFDDIVALVALFRPGPLQSGMVDDFIERKHGRATITYPHPDLKTILAPTYGVILYQEQVMQIAQILAGYSLGAADLLRKAMGKKKPEEMAKQRAVFMEGAAKNNIDKHVANGIFDLMEKFAGYGFNKSHSAGYALIAYQTAWLKTHYPAEFMAAVLSSDMDNTDKVVQFIHECRDLNLDVVPPHVNHSDYKFTVNADKQIVFGLGAIKGVGMAAIESIIAERGDGYKNLFELCQQGDTRKINKKVLAALIAAGAVDDLGPHRATMLASVETALKAAEQLSQRQLYGQNDIFADIAEDSSSLAIYHEMPEWNDTQRLIKEYETLGFYISGHPIDTYEAELEQFISKKIADVSQLKNQSLVIAGFITKIKTLVTKSGKKMAVMTIEDRNANLDITLFSDIYLNYRDQLLPGKLVIIEGDVSIDKFTGNFRMQAKRLFDIVEAREEFGKNILITTHQSKLSKETTKKLAAILQPYKNGNTPVCIIYERKEGSGKLILGDEWKVKPTDELLQKLRHAFGDENVIIQYQRN